MRSFSYLTSLWIAASPPCFAQTARLECREVAGLDSLFARNQVLWLGEMHGTAESPSFTANAACLALRAERPVAVALEIPAEEQARVDTFLKSSGSDDDVAALLNSPFWRSEYQDGRRSEAMLSLLKRLRELGPRLRAVLIDRVVFQTQPVERDSAMAETVAKESERIPNGIVLVLTGNLHARISRGSPWDPNYQSAAWRLTRRKPELRMKALNVSYQGGTAWTCTSASPSSCQVRELKGNSSAADAGVTLYLAVTDGYHGVYAVGTLTASPPAWK